MNKTMLKRRYARLTTCLFWLTLALLGLIWILDETGHFYGSIVCVVLMVLSVTAMVVVRTCFLRCPYCGKGIARPYWKPGEGHEQFCIKCGKLFIYDDEADDMADTSAD